MTQCSVVYDNYDDFQHLNFIFSQNFISLFWGLFNDEIDLKVRYVFLKRIWNKYHLVCSKVNTHLELIFSGYLLYPNIFIHDEYDIWFILIFFLKSIYLNEPHTKRYINLKNYILFVTLNTCKKYHTQSWIFFGIQIFIG